LFCFQGVKRPLAINEEHPHIPRAQPKMKPQQPFTRRHFMANQDLGLRQRLKKQQVAIHQQKLNQAHSEARLRLEFQQILEQREEAARTREQAMLAQLTALQVSTRPPYEVPWLKLAI
jgi:hypothetical protein